MYTSVLWFTGAGKPVGVVLTNCLLAYEIALPCQVASAARVVGAMMKFKAKEATSTIVANTALLRFDILPNGTFFASSHISCLYYHFIAKKSMIRHKIYV